MTMQFSDLLAAIGDEVDDAEEEAFLLFSQDIPSQNLGFLDSQSHTVELSVHDRDLIIHQSPTVLSSKRAGGTTGAVLWKITPLFAQWISSTSNILWESSILHPGSTAIELGCGVSGVLALSLGPSVGQYIATDQEYVRKLLQENLEENYHPAKRTEQSHRRHQQRSNPRNKSNADRRSAVAASADSQSRSRSRHNNAHSNESSRSPAARGAQTNSKIVFSPLDWETDTLSGLPDIGTVKNSGFDVLLACDCIYNDALIVPFVQTCADIARLRPSLAQYNDDINSSSTKSTLTAVKPTVCIIAQQLRSHEVLESWLHEVLVEFVVWRVKDEVLGSGLGTGSGYVVHVLILRE